MMTHLSVNFCIWYKVWIEVHFFAYGHPKHSLNICWKDYHFTIAFLSTFARNQLSIHEWVYFGLSILKVQWDLCISLLHCPDDCNVIIGSFAMLFWSLSPSQFHRSFRISLPGPPLTRSQTAQPPAPRPSLPRGGRGQEVLSGYTSHFPCPSSHRLRGILGLFPLTRPPLLRN